MLVMQVAKHSPETCPVYNEKYRALTLKWFESAEKLGEKFGVKMLGFWTDHPNHVVVMVFDVPSMDAFMGMMMQPEVLALLSFQKIRSFPVMDFKQTLDAIKQTH